MDYETLIFERDGEDAFATLTLNRPAKLNTMSGAMIAELDDVVQRCSKRDSPVKVLLIRGADRAFCAGYDMVQEGGAMDGEGWHDFILESCYGPLLRFWNAPIATVAAVHGHCLGGGLELAMCCDLVLAAEDAQLGAPEIRHVSAPPTLMLPWIAPIKHVRYLMYTGDTISGREAERMSLVNRAVPADSLMDEATRLTRKLARIPVPAIKLNKAAINHAQITAGLISSWQYNAETTALVHTGEPGLHWMRLLEEVGFKRFLEIREAPFAGLDSSS